MSWSSSATAKCWGTSLAGRADEIAAVCEPAGDTVERRPARGGEAERDGGVAARFLADGRIRDLVASQRRVVAEHEEASVRVIERQML